MTGIMDKALRYFGDNKIPAQVINIGAMDGELFDNLIGYVTNYKFPCLYVEPIPAMYERLINNPIIPHDINKFENSAIADYDGEIEMLTIDTAPIDSGEIIEAYYGMSAIWPPKNGLASDWDRPVVEKYGKRITVPCITLNTLWEKHGIEKIDVFKVDAEGYDYHIFKQLDLDKYRPTVIHIEWNNLEKEEQDHVIEVLTKYDYVWETETGDNLDAIPKEMIEPVAANFDRYQEYLRLAEEAMQRHRDAEKQQEQPKVEETPKATEYSRKNNNVTIVTGMWDLGRSALEDGFRRPFDHYLMKFAELLKADVNMYIYVPKDLEDFVWSIREPINTKIRLLDNEEMKTWFQFYDKVQEIRQKPEWKGQAAWLEHSPQANLDLYNPIVMSKMFFLNDASIYNPFGTDYFFWIDGGITNTVHWGYFQKDKVLNNLPYYYDLNNKFLFLSYPYEGNTEIHGFERERMAQISGTDYVRYVCRGGFFGGRKDHLNNINGLYYNYLQSTLNEGLMGTEESVFTIMAHRHDELIHRYEIGGDGMVWPFFEELKEIKDKVKTTVKGKKPFSEVKTSVYVVTFNFPKQFEHLCKSFEVADPNFLTKPRKIVLNNSTDRSTDAEYTALFEKYGWEEVKMDNIGICGGRQWCAEHFDQSDSDFMFFFEDDMLLTPPTQEFDQFGFRKYIDDLYNRTIRIAYDEDYDFIKMSFSELYGANTTQWAWYNIPQDIRERYFPEKTKLPVMGLDPNAPKTKFNNIKSVHGVTLVDGEVYYCNWPMIVTKEGNRKIFLQTKWVRPYEQTWMSYVFQEQKKGEITAAIFLLSPITHDRILYYKAEERKES